MDLTLIDTKLIERDYRNKFDFIEDVNLMLLNCLTYNGLENGSFTVILLIAEMKFFRLHETGAEAGAHVHSGLEALFSAE